MAIGGLVTPSLPVERLKQSAEETCRKSDEACEATLYDLIWRASVPLRLCTE